MSPVSIDAMRRTCNPEKPVRGSTLCVRSTAGKSSAWFEHSIDNRAAAGSTPASRTIFSCGQVNRCHAGLISHASGVQLASPQPVLGESFNGRTAGLQPANEGSIPSSSTSSSESCSRKDRQGGRCAAGQLTARRSENLYKHVRLVLLAPIVTVAEWLRRQTVNLSTRVQFPPVTPVARASFNG